jgi:hypothetical protein
MEPVYRATDNDIARKFSSDEVSPSSELAPYIRAAFQRFFGSDPFTIGKVVLGDSQTFLDDSQHSSFVLQVVCEDTRADYNIVLHKRPITGSVVVFVPNQAALVKNPVEVLRAALADVYGCSPELVPITILDSRDEFGRGVVDYSVPYF